ncbi:hypothetical protein HB364_16280 [Pseudoflavitalea sp. X16]|uniref:hypothetical protein n=1 Tax=Paraflavitalea devenefica TaxID=2716334 RepID=UPI0014209E35|nr:hypothetical protein [Paraflavitalea devenefica]NII26648.1 hypothetical protein [Paraflavitalea devenefica]
MAKYTGIPPLTGTIGPICIYKMYGQYYIRTRSSLTGKRVKKDPAFRKTMQYAALLGKASRIGSAVYAALPEHRKQHALYRKFTGEAMTWLKYQWTEEDIVTYLIKQYTGQEVVLPEPEVVQLREPFRRKTQRLKGKQRRQHTEVPEEKLPYHLYAYRYNERKFRQQRNKELTTYPWAECILNPFLKIHAIKG